MTTFDTRSYAAADAPLPPGRGVVRITPTRRHIDNRYPALGFTVDAAGYFEVLLAADRALFDPANAARRTPSTFYASREHSGLIRGGDEPSVYLVPAAVMQRFAGAREIFYTAVSYDSPQGQNPTYAMPPAQLPREAPSVGVASDFHGKSVAASFALPGSAVLRVRELEAEAAPAAPDDAYAADAFAAAPASGSDAEADADRAGGEDGYGMTAALDDYDDGYGAMAHGYEDESEEPAPAAAAGGAAAELDYDDGYDGPIQAAAQQSAYPPDAPVPAMLDDEDEERREHDGTYAAEAAAYGDEADESASGGTAAAAMQAVALTPREQRRIMDTVLALNYPCPSSYSLVIPGNDSTVAAPADGLQFGIVPFRQFWGTLGKLLEVMEQRDPAACVRIFGTKWRDLLHTANAAQAPDRMRKVEDKELWHEPWLSRFRQAGEHPPFQAAQNETAAKVFLQPVIPIAKGLGLNTDRGLAMLAAMVLQRSTSMWIDRAVGDTLQTALDAVNPLKTRAQEQQVLANLGTQFQQAHHIDPARTLSGEALLAVLAELRTRGNSPVPLPAPTQMLDAVVQHVRNTTSGQAVADMARLRTLTCLTDVEFTL